MKKVFKQKKIESHTQNPIEPTNEIFFRLKRPVDKKVCDFIYLENSVKKPKPNPENENEKNIYKLMQDLSLEPNPSASKQLFTHKAYILKRVETNYVKKKQAEINEKFNSEKRFEKFQKIRMISTKPEDSSMEKMKKTPELQKIAYILEKYKKLEEEELKIKENESEKKNEKKSMIFYDLNYEKNNNSILFNDLPTNFNYLLSSAKKEKESNEIEIENQTTDYYILTQYAQESDKISKVEGSIPKVDIDLDLLKPYHYENYFDESNKLVEQRTEDSPRNEDSCDSNSENNPNNDYPEEISENDDEKNGFSSNEDGEENSRKIHNDDEEKEDLYFEGEQENEFYENFKKKIEKDKPKEFLEDDNYEDF